MNPRSLLMALAVAALTLGNLNAADEKKDKKADPAGAWTWTTSGQNGNTYTQSIRFKHQGDKLVGTLAGRRDNADTPLEDIKVNGNEISFQLTRERNGEKRVSKYKGKIEGDTIKGTVESGANNRSREWVAKREAKKD